MLKLTRLTPRICCAKRTTFLTVRSKFTKEQVIRRLMKEQKQCFGALLETQSQKRKRLKLEKKGVIDPKISKSDVDSELSWVQKHSKMRLIRVKRSVVQPPVSVDAPEKVVLIKSYNKHVRASTEAAEGLLTKFDNRVPLVMDNKNPLIKSVVQKRILRKVSLNPSTATKMHCENRIMLRPEDIIKNISEAKLFKETKETKFNKEADIISISRMEDKKALAYPSVTRILNATMSDTAKRMIELWMARMIKELGQEGFDKYKSDLFKDGQIFHLAIERTLKGLPLAEIPPSCQVCFDSVKDVLKEVKSVSAIESQVVHRDLGYRGVLDCVASYRGNVYLIDWKKCHKSKEVLSATYDAPLQIASYIGALNADDKYPFQVKSGLLVIAYTIGDKPRLHYLDQTKLQYYWKQWLQRLKKYYDTLCKTMNTMRKT